MHDKWHVVIKWLVVFVTLGLDARQARDEHDGVRRDLLDDRVMVGSIQRIEEFASGRPLVANVILDARDVDLHRLDRHVLDLAVVVVALVRIDDLDAEHGGQRANQRIYELRLLRHEQRPALQLGERDVDLIDNGRHRVCRNPNLVKCGGEAQHLEKWGFGVL